MRVTIPYSVEIDLTVEVEYSPGRPAFMYLRNGAPGYPAEPDEAEITDVPSAVVSQYLFDETPPKIVAVDLPFDLRKALINFLANNEHEFNRIVERAAQEVNESGEE